MDKLKKFLVIHVKGFDPDTMCACTLLFEGKKDDVLR